MRFDWPSRRPIDLRRRRILVSGATGFLGRSLLDYLDIVATKFDGGFAVRALSRDPDRFLTQWPRYRVMPWLQFVKANVDGAIGIHEPFSDVIHAAGETHSAGAAASWVDRMVDGTRAMLDVAVASGAERFLFVSSGAVYGAPAATLSRIPETETSMGTGTRTLGAYGQAKHLSEQLCLSYQQQHGIATVAARLFALVSPHVPLDGAYAIGNFIRDALQRPHITVSGDGLDMRSYIDGEDAAHWLMTLLRHGSAGTAYNVGSEHGIAIADLARTVRDLLAPDKSVMLGCAQLPGAKRNYVPDTARARALGLTIGIELRQAIRRAAQASDGQSSHPRA